MFHNNIITIQSIHFCVQSLNQYFSKYVSYFFHEKVESQFVEQIVAIVRALPLMAQLSQDILAFCFQLTWTRTINILFLFPSSIYEV